jgi:hypothetical protein
MALYRKILSQSWQIIWQNKYLWFFGLFAAFLGPGGGFEVLLRGLSGESKQDIYPTLQMISETGLFGSQGLANLGYLLAKEPFKVLFIFFIWLFIIVIICFLIWFSNVSLGALVNNAAQIISKKKVEFQEGLNIGMEKFWPVFGLNLISKVITTFLILLISFPLFMPATQASSVVTNLVYGMLFIICIPLAVIVSYVIKYAIAFVVIKKSHVIDSIILGWQLFIMNWLVTLELAFILLFINIVVYIGLFILFLMMALPILFLAYLSSQIIALSGFWVVIMIGLILILAIIILVGTILVTYQISAWTSLFVELISKGGKSKLIRTFGREK